MLLLRIALFFASFIFLHIAIVADYTGLAFRLILYVLIGTLATPLIFRRVPQKIIRVLALTIVGALAFFTVEWLVELWPAFSHYVIYLPSIAMNAFMAALFFRTLLPGHVPLITHFSYMVHTQSPFSPGFLNYTKNQTMLWAFLCLGCAFGSIYLAALDDMEGWSTFSNIITPSMFVAVFLLSHIYSAVHYKVKESPGRTLRILCTQPGIWLQTKIKEVPYDYRAS